MSAPDLSIIIPYYNRADTIAHTLRSLELARHDLTLEILLIDDGSSPAFTEAVPAPTRALVTRIIRQPNQGLLFARLAGFAAATGAYTLFLDSDDLVGPDKLVAQLAAMRSADADVSYTDVASMDFPPDFDQPRLFAENRPEATDDPVDFFLRIQPAPHSPVFRTAHLRQVVAQALCPPDARYNPVAEVWFYFQAAVHPGRVIKVPGLHTWIGVHPGPRISGHWEKMGFAAVALTSAFLAACPRTEATRSVRQALASSSFQAWRALPHDYCPAYQQRLLSFWRMAPDPAAAARGGSGFRRLAGLIGPVLTGRLLRRLRGHAYASCRTVDEDTLRTLAATLPPDPNAPAPR